MNALPMIERCLRHHADVHLILPDWDGPATPPHPNAECDRIAEAQVLGPNLVLWTGRQHKLVLTIKP